MKYSLTFNFDYNIHRIHFFKQVNKNITHSDDNILCIR
nr:MAG TPA: hypothetical protein [Caudoviricetes sp.]